MAFSFQKILFLEALPDMPTLTRWYIKTAMVYLALALAAGILLAAQQVWAYALPSITVLPVYIHLLVVGWLTLLILGVAHWMFPKYSIDLPRGNQALAWASFILLNAGLALRVISEPAMSVVKEPSRPVWGVMLVIAAILQWLGGMTFVANTWARVKER